MTWTVVVMEVVKLIAQGQFQGMFCRHGWWYLLWMRCGARVEKVNLTLVQSALPEELEEGTCHLLRGEGSGRMRHGEEYQESIWDTPCRYMWEHQPGSWIHKMELGRSLGRRDKFRSCWTWHLMPMHSLRLSTTLLVSLQKYYIMWQCKESDPASNLWQFYTPLMGRTMKKRLTTICSMFQIVIYLFL